MATEREVSINVSVTLDENNVPTEISWSSDDPPSEGKPAPAKAFFMSLFDQESLETLKIDLWTTKLEVGEMDRLMYNTLRGLADSYNKATNNGKMANDVARFAQYFGEEQGILQRPKEEEI